jgi:integrase
VQWFAASHLLQQDSRDTLEQVDSHDIQQWMSRLLDRYSGAYASNQYRALQQFFKWLAAEDELPDPTARLQPPPVPQQLIPVFTGQELARHAQAAPSRSGATPRSSRYSRRPASGCPNWPASATTPVTRGAATSTCGSGHLTVRGKGGKPRIVRIGHQAARSLDRYLRARTRHAQAWRNQLWLGIGNRERLNSAGIYQMIARRGRLCGVAVHPHRFRHHFSHTWLDRGARARRNYTASWTTALTPGHNGIPQLSTRQRSGAPPAELSGQRGHGKPGMDADAPPRKTSPGAAPSWHTPKLCPAAAAPRTRRCPVPGADSQTETMAITQGQLPHNAESRPVAPIAD